VGNDPKIGQSSGRRVTNAYYARWRCDLDRKAGRQTFACRFRVLPSALAKRKRDLASSSLPSALVGHVGDGNFHLVFMIDPNRPEEIAEASRLNDRMVARALAMEGTCTGEHGVGYGKMEFLVSELGEGVSVMRAIKRALEPNQHPEPGQNRAHLIKRARYRC